MMGDIRVQTSYVDSLNPIQRQLLAELGIDFLWGESLAPKFQRTVHAGTDSIAATAEADSVVELVSHQPLPVDKQEPVIMATQEIASANADMARKMLQRAKHRLPSGVTSAAALATTTGRIRTPAQQPASPPNLPIDSTSGPTVSEFSDLSWQELCDLAATQEFDMPLEERVVSVVEDKSEGRQCDWLFIDQLFYLDAERYGLTKAKQVQTLFGNMLFALGLEQNEVAVLPLFKSQTASQKQPTVGPILLEQIKRLQPKCIVALGDVVISLLQADKGFLALMNQTQAFHHPELGQIPLVTIFSPYYLLSNGTAKAQTWQGLQRARQVVRGTHSA